MALESTVVHGQSAHDLGWVSTTWFLTSPCESSTSPMVLVGPPPSLLRLAPDLCICGSYPYPWVHLLACPSQSWHLLAGCCQVTSGILGSGSLAPGVESSAGRRGQEASTPDPSPFCDTVLAEGRWSSSSGVRGTSVGILQSSG